MTDWASISTTFLILLLVLHLEAGARRAMPSHLQAPPSPPVMPGPTHQCETHTDCEEHHFCLKLTADLSICQSFKASAPLFEDSCKGSDGEASHEVCNTIWTERKQQKKKYSPMRCFSQLGFKCHFALYMPCNQTQSCPQHFDCQDVKYKSADHSVKACVPETVWDNKPRSCTTDFDCGFSVTMLSWNACEQGQCRVNPAIQTLKPAQSA